MDIFHRVNKIMSLTIELQGDLEGVLEELREEEVNSQDEADRWDEESGGPEPEVIDNSEEISVLEEQIMGVNAVIAALESLR